MTPFLSQSMIEITFRRHDACLDVHPRSDSTESAEAVLIAPVGGIGVMRIFGSFPLTLPPFCFEASSLEFSIIITIPVLAACLSNHSNLNPFVPMEFPIIFDKVKSEWSIISSRWSQVIAFIFFLRRLI